MSCGCSSVWYDEDMLQKELVDSGLSAIIDEFVEKNFNIAQQVLDGDLGIEALELPYRTEDDFRAKAYWGHRAIEAIRTYLKDALDRKMQRDLAESTPFEPIKVVQKVKTPAPLFY